MYKRNVNVCPRGSTSPMAGIEIILVSTALQMESNREPLSVSESIDLANSMIKDTIHQEELIKWKIKHIGKSQANRDSAIVGTLAQNNGVASCVAIH
jgi:hypothetical protein